MIGRLLSRLDLFLYAYLVMVLGCIYFLFNYIEGISFSEKAGESVLFRLSWLTLYLILLIKISQNARALVLLIERSVLLLLFFGAVAISLLYNADHLDSVLKFSMYIATVLFAGWVAVSCPVDRFVEALFKINVAVLVFHIAIYPVVGSAIDYDPLHRATILGTEAYAGVFGHKNLAGWFFGLMALIALIRALTRPGHTNLSSSAIIGGLDVIALAATGAAGPLISACASLVIILGTYLVLVGRRELASIYWIACGFVLLGVASLPNDYLLGLVGRSSGLTGRDFLWEAWPHFFWQKPMLGYGFAGFFTGVVNAPSVELTQMAPWNAEYYSFENSYLEALLEFGLLGGITFFLITCCALWNAFRFALKSPSAVSIAPFSLLIFVLISSMNDDNLLLHNYFACVVMFWCYFGVEARSLERRAAGEELRMHHA